MKQTFVIRGIGNTPEEIADSLIALEPILVALGYKSDEGWNKTMFNGFDCHKDMRYIICSHKSKKYDYHNHPCRATTDTAINANVAELLALTQ